MASQLQQVDASRSRMGVGRVGVIAVVSLAVVAGIVGLVSQKAALVAVLFGLGGGALIAVIAIGVVLTYRGSGVINFSVGAIAMYVAYVFANLRSIGRLWVPPFEIHLGGPMGIWPALVISIVIATVLGLLCYVLVFRWLREVSPVAMLVASVGLFLVLQAVAVLEFGSSPVPLTPLLGKVPIKLPDGIIVPQDQLILSAIVVVVAGALGALMRFSRLGLAMRAATENEKGAVLLGHSPDFLGCASWVLTTVIVGTLGILAATVNGEVDPQTIPLLIIPALAAALLGGLTSFGLAVAGAFGIGLMQSLITYLGTKSWFPTAQGAPLPGVQETLPFLIVIVVLVFRGSKLPLRGSLRAIRLPFAPEPRKVGIKFLVCLVVSAIALFTFGPNWRLGLINSEVGVVFCLSLVILTGFVGQVSLAQIALAGIGGFTLSKLAGAGVPFPIAPLLGALAGTAVGGVVAIPALRIRGVQLAVVTFAAADLIQQFVFNNPTFSGGLQGALVGPPRFLGLKFGLTDPTSIGDGLLPNPFFGVFCVIVVALLCLVVVNLRRSSAGRRMLAVRSNERAAAAAGINVSQTKLFAFVVAGFVAGLGGALSSYRFGSVSPDYFTDFTALAFLAFAYMGGISSVTGAVLGGLFVTNGLLATALNSWFGLSDEYIVLLGGVGLILTVILNPEGIAGAARDARLRLQQRSRASLAETGEGWATPEDAPQEIAAVDAHAADGVA